MFEYALDIDANKNDPQVYADNMQRMGVLNSWRRLASFFYPTTSSQLATGLTDESRTGFVEYTADSIFTSSI